VFGIGLVDGVFDLAAAVTAGVAVFLAWAIGRELDPDRPASADIAMVLALPAFFGGEPSLVAAAITLFAVRILAGTVGRRLFLTDGLVLIGAGAAGGLSPEAWPAVLALAAVVGWDRSLPMVFSLAIAGAGIAAALATGPDVTRTFGTLSGLAVAAALLAALVRVPQIVALPDSGAGTIHAGRVTAARILAASVVTFGSVLTPDGAWAVAPVIAALIGVGVVSIVRPVEAA
jgi:hypothetical protein